MTRRTVLELLVMLILIYLSGYFSSAETAFSTVSQISLKTRADEGDKRAASTLKLLGSYSKLISTILICNNVVNIAASALLTSMVIRLFGESLVTVGTLLLTVAILLFGEITPKNTARIKALEKSLALTPVFFFLMKFLTPVIYFIDLLSKGLMKLMRVDTSLEKKITAGELRTYVKVGSEEGIIQSGEKKIIDNVFDFGDSVAKDIMVPRIDMSCVSVDASYDEILELFRRDMFTRLPVYGSDPDSIIGLINIKDFIVISDRSAFDIHKILRDAYYTYEYKKTSELMKEIQKRSCSVAFVLDEYGITVGMVTLEDIMEEIVGEIRDEYDEEERELVHKYDDLTYLVEGSMKLDDVNDVLGSDFASEDYDSIGGLMIEQLDRLPRNQEIVALENGITLQAKGIRQNRIVKVLLRFRETPGAAEGRTDEEALEEMDS